MNRLRAQWMRGIAFGTRDRDAEHEHLAMLNGAHSAQHFGIGEEIQAADFVIGTPPAPILRRILQKIGHFDYFAGHDSPPSGIGDIASYMRVYKERPATL